MPIRRPLHTIRRAVLVALLLGSVPFVSPASAHDDGKPVLTRGQSIYVPVYSKVLHGNINKTGQPNEILLSSMLSVRNTDPKYPLVLTAVRYYDTDGRVLRDYITTPKTLPPMGSTDFFVEYQEKFGGTGANFIVTWSSSDPINAPIMETVHVYFWGNQSKAFISRGQVIDPHTSP